MTCVLYLGILIKKKCKIWMQQSFRIEVALSGHQSILGSPSRQAFLRQQLSCFPIGTTSQSQPGSVAGRANRAQAQLPLQQTESRMYLPHTKSSLAFSPIN